MPNSLAWTDVDQHLELTNEDVRIASGISTSPYAERFRNGATVFPRVLFCVEEQDAGPLGTSSGRVRVISTRSSNEKEPWKFVPPLSGVVEREFVRPVVMSECLLPFRLTEPIKAVLPILGDSLLSEGPLGIDAYDGLSGWWSTASDIWLDKRSSERLSLIEQLNYMRKLGEQLPTADLRVVYNKSGMHVLAAKISDRRAVVENGLYWMTASSNAEADYLCALINSSKTTELVRPLMSYGKDERDIAKSIWQLPIPEFDPENSLHQELSELGAALAEEVAEFRVDPDVYFPTTRRRFRDALETSDAMQSASAIVSELVDL